jgi:hypothetical protein
MEVNENGCFWQIVHGGLSFSYAETSIYTSSADYQRICTFFFFFTYRYFLKQSSFPSRPALYCTPRSALFFPNIPKFNTLLKTFTYGMG